jgi:hypothetical protein
MASQKNKKETDNRAQDDKDLPGYPHYPSEDDIMNPQRGFKKIAADDELANSRRLSGNALNRQPNNDDNPEPEESDELKIVSGTDADVTSEDLALLGDRNADADNGDDELVGNARVDEREEGEDEDLDIPGAELDDKEENIGEEDEENNYYSLGGDRHDNLEEDPPNDNE